MSESEIYVDWHEFRPANDGYVLPAPLAWDDEMNELVIVRSTDG